MAFVRKTRVKGMIYIQVVENERIGARVVQKFICSLGEVNDLIEKLEGMKNG